MLGGSVAKSRADVAHLVDCVGNAVVYAGRGLEHRCHQLLAHAAVLRGVGHLIEARHKLVALGRDELELFLDTETEWRTATERVLHAPDRSGCAGR